MHRTVVIGVDNSEHSEYAFDFYIKYAMIKGDKLILVHVSEYTSMVQAPTLLTDPVLVTDLIRDEEAKVKQVVDKYSQKMKQLRLRGKVKQMSGYTGKAICVAAKEENADLIVIGTMEMGKIQRQFIGNISDYIIHHSHVPVLICPVKGQIK